MIQKNYKKVKNYMIPRITIMKSIKDNTMTESVMSKMEVDVKMDERRFDKNALDR